MRFLLLLLISITANANDRFGDWAVITEKNVVLAATENSHSEIIGVLCTDSCLVYMQPNVRCEANNKIPVLISSSAGTLSETLSCEHINNKQILVFSNYDGLIRSLEAGSGIGIAMALDGGDFVVSRFSTSGAIPAIRQAVSIKQNAPKAPVKKDKEYM